MLDGTESRRSCGWCGSRRLRPASNRSIGIFEKWICAGGFFMPSLRH